MATATPERPCNRCGGKGKVPNSVAERIATGVEFSTCPECLGFGTFFHRLG